MVARGKEAFKKAMLRVSAGVFAAGLLTFASLAPASAQGIFERIFGGMRHAVEAPAGLPADIQRLRRSVRRHENAPSQRVPKPPRRAAIACAPATAFTSRCRRMPA